MIKKDKIVYANLKVPVDVKKRMDNLKGRDTYAKFLDDSMSFFEMTNVNPKHNQLPPSLTITKAINEATKSILNRVEYSITIIRNIENKKIDTILHAVDNNTVRPGEDEEPELSANDLEVKQLVDVNLRLESENRQLKENIYLSKTDGNKRLEEMVAIIEDLLSDSKLQSDNDDHLIMTKDYRNALIQKIRTATHV